MEKNKKSLPKSFGLFAFVFVSLISAITLIVGLGTKVFKNNVEKPDYLEAGSVPSHTKGLVENGDGTYELSLDVTGESRERLNKVNVVVVLDSSGSMAYPAENYSETGRYGFSSNSFHTLYRKNGNNYSQVTDNTTEGPVYTRSGGGWSGYTYTEFNGPRYTSNSTNYTTRMTGAQGAVNDLANVLLSKNGTGDKADLVEMALIDFDTTASVKDFRNSGSRRNVTTQYSEFRPAVNGTSSGGGTNWEDALQKAKSVDFGDDDTTYVIFVSDGNPTFRNTPGNYTQMDKRTDFSVYGTGRDDATYQFTGYSITAEETITRCYNHALDDAQALVTDGVEFYTIGAYGNVSRMQSLTTGAGALANHYFSAANTDELKTALNTILDAITKEGIGAVSINDGTTNQVSVGTSVVELLEVDTSSFEYFKDGVKWDDAPEATFENGQVKWDLESVGILDNGVTYKVTFDVYPSQYTNDLIADLKNGKVQYSELQASTGKYAGLDKYIKPSGSDYTLETNTTATLKYKDTRVSDSYQDPALYKNPDPVYTTPDQISVHKQWENDFDARSVEKVDVGVLRDKESFHTFTLRASSWAEGPFNISSGLMRVHYAADDTTITGIEVLTPGHDYTFDELGEESYNWEMVAQTIHPMVINNQLTELILIDKAVTSNYTTDTNPLAQYSIPKAMVDDESLQFYQANGKNYYRLDLEHPEKVYVQAASTQPTIEAYNYRRSNLNIEKKVDGESANPDDLFTFDITVKDTGLSTGEDIWFSVYDGQNVTLGNRLVSTGWTTYVNEDNETYYHAPSGTKLTVQLKAGENLRFTNLTTDATFEVVEQDPSVSNYSYSKGEFHAWYGKDKNEGKPELGSTYTEGTTIDNANRKVSGKISLTNSSFYVWMTNTYELVDVEVEKEFDDANNQDDIRPETITVNLLADGKTAKDTEGNNIEPVEVAIDAAGKGSYTFEDLPRFNSDGKEIKYTVTEEPVKGYTTEIVDTRETDPTTGEVTTVGKFSYKITNTHEPDTRVIKVKKVYEDDNDRDGLRKEAVITLNADGQPTENVFRTSVNAETTFTVPVNKARTAESPAFGAINYTVTEPAMANYTTDITGDAATGFVVTNTHEPAKATTTVTKIWDDENNRDNIRPTSIKVTLHNDKDNKTVDYTLNADNNWTITLDTLPANYNDGTSVTPIKYSWTEDEKSLPTGYKLTSTGIVGNNYTFTNTHTPNTKTIKVSKVWDDENNRDNKRTEAVITLNADNVATENVLRTLVNADATYTVPVNKARTTESPEFGAITYSVTENSIAEYTTDISGDADKGFVVTNKHTIDTKDIKVSKVWDDENNRDNKRKNAVITLKADNETAQAIKADGTTEAAVLTTLTDETVTYKVPVNKARADGAEFGGAITYSVVEDPIAEYTTTISGNEKDGFVVTNKHTIDTKEIKVTKVWDDENNRDNKRTNAVITLKADNETAQAIKADGTTEDAILTTLTNETVTYKVPVNKARAEGASFGGAIKYSVSENSIAEYTTTISGNETDGFVVTNKHTPDTIDIKVSKVWDDGNNQDGKRKQAIITLNADGEATDNVLLAYETNAETTFTVPVNKARAEGAAFGGAIVYSVTENEIPEYNTTISGDAEKGFVVTNQYTPKTTSLTIIKDWDDERNQDGARPESLVVTLSDGTNNTEVTLNAGNNWSKTLDNLPVYKDGKELSYSWSEGTLPAGYKLTDVIVDEKDPTITTLVNTYKPKTITVKVTKDWVDKENQDGLRGNYTIVLTATAEGKEYNETYTKTLQATELSYSWDNLPAYYDGVEITYTLAETEYPDGYTPKVTAKDGYEFEVTNTHEPAKVSVTATKKWEDNNNQDGLRTPTVKFELLANGEGTGVYKETTASNPTVTFDNLNKNIGGQPVNYSVQEVEVPKGYTPQVTGDMEKGFTVTNFHTPDTTEETFIKVWEDGDNHDGFRPDSIPLTLKGDNKVVEATPTITKDGNTWTIKYTGLPKFAGSTTPIVYTIEEGTVDNYQGVVDGNTITNTHTPETVDIKVAKQWYDNSNQDGARPGNVTLTLYADGVEVDSATFNGEGNVWYHTFEKLDKYKNVDGKPHEIVYTVDEKDEDVPEGYEKTKDGLTIKNTHNIATTEVTGTKIWDDADNQDGIRPDSVTVKLLANGSEALHSDGKTKVEPITVNEANKWTYTFTDLPKYQNGAPITYTVAETKDVKGYNPEIIVENDKINIKNTHTPETVTISGTKIWDDADDQDGKRPDSITIKLMVGDDVIQSTNVTADDDWAWAFTDLPKNDKGTAIQYKIVEVKVDEYNEPVVKPVEESEYEYTVTNTHTPETVTYTINKDWRDDEDRDGIRPDSIVINILANGKQAHYNDGTPVPEQVITDADKWNITIANLPKYSKGKLITYSFTEVVVEGYETEIVTNESNPTSITIINTHTPETTELDITKTWEEDQYYLDRRPDMITVDIYADGVYLDTIKVYKDDNWTAKVTNLYKYSNGKEITYTIKEYEVEGYVSQVVGSQEDGYTITNIFVDGEGCTDCEEPPATRIDITFDNSKEYYAFTTLLLGAVALSSVKKYEM